MDCNVCSSTTAGPCKLVGSEQCFPYTQLEGHGAESATQCTPGSYACARTIELHFPQQSYFSFLGSVSARANFRQALLNNVLSRGSLQPADVVALYLFERDGNVIAALEVAADKESVLASIDAVVRQCDICVEHEGAVLCPQAEGGPMCISANPCARKPCTNGVCVLDSTAVGGHVCLCSDGACNADTEVEASEVTGSTATSGQSGTSPTTIAVIVVAAVVAVLAVALLVHRSRPHLAGDTGGDKDWMLLDTPTHDGTTIATQSLRSSALDTNRNSLDTLYEELHQHPAGAWVATGHTNPTHAHSRPQPSVLEDLYSVPGHRRPSQPQAETMQPAQDEDLEPLYAIASPQSVLSGIRSESEAADSSSQRRESIYEVASPQPAQPHYDDELAETLGMWARESSPNSTQDANPEELKLQSRLADDLYSWATQLEDPAIENEV